MAEENESQTQESQQSQESQSAGSQQSEQQGFSLSGGDGDAFTQHEQQNQSSDEPSDEGGDQSQQQPSTWYNLDEVPEEYREFYNSPTVQNAKDIHELVKKVVHQEKHIRNKGLAKPGEDATEEEIAAYRKNFGVPDKPEDYQRPEIAQEHEGIVTPQDFDLAASVAHKAGLDGNQASVVMEGLKELRVAEHQSQEAESQRLGQETYQELEQIYGQEKLRELRPQLEKFVNNQKEQLYPGYSACIQKLGVANATPLLRDMIDQMISSRGTSSAGSLGSQGNTNRSGKDAWGQVFDMPEGPERRAAIERMSQQ